MAASCAARSFPVKISVPRLPLRGLAWSFTFRLRGGASRGLGGGGSLGRDGFIQLASSLGRFRGRSTVWVWSRVSATARAASGASRLPFLSRSGLLNCLSMTSDWVAERLLELRGVRACRRASVAGMMRTWALTRACSRPASSGGRAPAVPFRAGMTRSLGGSARRGCRREIEERDDRERWQWLRVTRDR